MADTRERDLETSWGEAVTRGDESGDASSARVIVDRREVAASPSAPAGPDRPGKAASSSAGPSSSRWGLFSPVPPDAAPRSRTWQLVAVGVALIGVAAVIVALLFLFFTGGTDGETSSADSVELNLDGRPRGVDDEVRFFEGTTTLPPDATSSTTTAPIPGTADRMSESALESPQGSPQSPPTSAPASASPSGPSPGPVSDEPVVLPAPEISDFSVFYNNKVQREYEGGVVGYEMGLVVTPRLAWLVSGTVVQEQVQGPGVSWQGGGDKGTGVVLNGVALCPGEITAIPDGARICTASPGTYDYTITATGLDGKKHTASTTFTISGP